MLKSVSDALFNNLNGSFNENCVFNVLDIELFDL